MDNGFDRKVLSRMQVELVAVTANAEALIKEADALYRAVGEAALPAYVREAAKQK